jgi:anaerobic selenocysteine-containing dehydrogenase
MTIPATTTSAVAPPETRIVTGVCPHDCPDSCGWVVTVEDRGGGPVPVQLRGNPSHPYSKGELCPKVNRFLDRVLSSDRILTPLRRTGPKGSGEFEPVSWDYALQEIGQRWQTILATDGANAIMPFSSAGNQGSLALEFSDRLFSALGTSRQVGSVCGLTAGAGVALTYGSGEADDPTELRFAKVILLWGTNTRLTNRHLWPYVEQARANGATVVVIDPIRTMTADSADVFLQPLPGTDVALILAMMHVLIRDAHIDREYIAAHTTGYEELAAHVTQWSPARAAGVCGLSVDEIEFLAKLYATGGPAFIRTLIGAEHAAHGAQFFRTLAMLPVLIGAWKHRGGGFARSVGTYAGAALSSLARAELSNGSHRRSLSQNHIGRWLTDPNLDPPVRSLLVYGANPLVTIPNRELIRQGLLREDLFTIVHEQFMTDTARYADIVLPATTQIEAIDVMGSWGSPHITYNNAAISPMGESVSNSELFRRLASAMEMHDPLLHESDEALCEQLFANVGPRLRGVTLDDLRNQDTIRIDLEPQRYAHGGFATKDGKVALASDAVGALGLGRLPDWQAADEGIHGEENLAERFPFVVLTPKTHTRFLNSSYSHLRGHGDREGGPFVELCADDASLLGVVDGVIVRVHNDRGAINVPVRVSKRVRPGVVAVPFGWGAAGHGEEASVNSLTNDELVDHGGSVAYNDTRVAITLR